MRRPPVLLAVGTLTVQWIDNPHEIGLEVASESKAADGNYDVTVMLALPISSLSLIEEAGFSRASCQVAVVVLNSEGQLSRPQFLELPIQIPTQDVPAAMAQSFGGTLTLRVGPGIQRLAVGLWEDGDERDEPEGYHKDFGVALCRRGFAVAAPEISCFGERQNDFSHLGKSPVPSTCSQTAALANHMGGSVLGLRVHDARRLV